MLSTVRRLKGEAVPARFDLLQKTGVVILGTREDPRIRRDPQVAPSHVLLGEDHFEIRVDDVRPDWATGRCGGREIGDLAAERPGSPGGPRLMYLLDTNVVSELRKARSGRADERVTTWAAEVPVASLFVSVVTLQDLEIGVLLAERRDPPQGAILRSWLDDHVLPAFADRILPIDARLDQGQVQIQMHSPARQPA